VRNLFRAGAVLASPLLLSLMLVGGSASATNSTTGNGAPSGPHFDLNIHGTNGPVDMSTGSNGHDIFVPLTTSGTDSSVSEDCDDIQLSSGTTFAVVNPDCWTGVAKYPEFQLPPPCSSTTTTSCTTAYTVWVRALTPQGHANMQTCYTDTTSATPVTYCATGAQVVYLSKKSSAGDFTDVTQALLFYCSAGSKTLQPIFSTSNYTYFWDYDNSGLKHAQLRFYQTSEMVNFTSCMTAGF
jgi:hypothetical protein